MQHAGIAAVVDVVTGHVAQRAVLPVAGDGAVNDGRVVRAHARVIGAEPRHDPGAKALDDDVGSRSQVHEGLHALGLLQIQLEAALVAVDEIENRGDARLVVGPALTRIVARARVFDLDDVRAHVRQVQTAHGAGEEPGQIQNADVGERLTAHGESGQRRCRSQPDFCSSASSSGSALNRSATRP